MRHRRRRPRSLRAGRPCAGAAVALDLAQECKPDDVQARTRVAGGTYGGRSGQHPRQERREPEASDALGGSAGRHGGSVSTGRCAKILRIGTDSIAGRRRGQQAIGWRPASIATRFQ